MLRKEAHLRALSILLYVCLLSTFGGLCVYYALDVTVKIDSVVAAAPVAGAEWNCSLLVKHTDLTPTKFDNAWLKAAAKAPGSGVTVVTDSGFGISCQGRFKECIEIAVPGVHGPYDAPNSMYINVGLFDPFDISNPLGVELAPGSLFYKFSYKAAYFSNFAACNQKLEAALSSTLLRRLGVYKHPRIWW